MRRFDFKFRAFPEVRAEMATVRDLLAGLTPDSWRADVGFSSDIDVANERLSQVRSKAEKAAIINEWLGAGRNQPCLFGRMAARLKKIGFCVLDETDLQGTDETLQASIQDGRLDWVRRTYRGEQSAFVLVVHSERIARAVPDDTMKALAARIILLYLQREPEHDSVMLEEVFLEQPARDPWTWRWDAGVNYFSAQGDGRWWHDHRIPGGLAFSVNSVGHLAKSTRLSELVGALGSELGVAAESPAAQPVDSLEKALEFAMRTIDGSSNAISGKATCLVDRRSGAPECPFPIPNHLKDKDASVYLGRYHTDHTLPSDYFKAAVERPPDTATHDLDFTYLWLRSPDNPAYFTMGEGVRIRADESMTPTGGRSKQGRFVPEAVDGTTSALLQRAFEAET